MNGGELSQIPAEQQKTGLKKIPIEQTYPPGGSGTMISIQKKDVFAGAGEKAVTAKQQKILTDPVDPKDVRILPDTASLYLPWSWFAARLTKAFGPMGWSLTPVTDRENNPIPPVAKDNVMYREFILTADGRFVGSAVGECAYNPTNKRMTYGDAVEGAKSNALSRCCKALGIAPEIYSEGWREDWIQENAICVNAENWDGKIKQLWRRKNALPLKGERGHAKGLCPCAPCKSGAPGMSPDGKPIIDEPKETPPAEWSGVVEKVNVVVKQNKSDPERFNVTGNNAKFYTLDKAVATRAKAAMDSGDHVRIHHKPGKWGQEITALLVIEQPPEQSESGGQED